MAANFTHSLPSPPTEPCDKLDVSSNSSKETYPSNSTTSTSTAHNFSNQLHHFPSFSNDTSYDSVSSDNQDIDKEILDAFFSTSHELDPRFASRYRITNELGRGGFGFVVTAVIESDFVCENVLINVDKSRSSRTLELRKGREVAVKFIYKRRIPTNGWVKDYPLFSNDSHAKKSIKVPMEIYILRRVQHCNVICCLDLYEDEKFFYLVMEMHGGIDPSKAVAKPNIMNQMQNRPASPVTTTIHAMASFLKFENGNDKDMKEEEESHGHVVCPEGGICDPARKVVMMDEDAVEARLRLEKEMNASLHVPNVLTRSQSFPLPPSLLRRPSMDLFECIEKNRRLNENQARTIFRQIVEAVNYLHSHRIVHRDIKDENIVVDNHFNAKIIDFGSAAVEPTPNYLFDRFAGTIQYAAPEILRGEKYSGRASDIWCLGILLYTILCGQVPFANKDDAVNVNYKRPSSRVVCAEGTDLIEWLLQKSPRRRPSTDLILRHPWIVGRFKAIPIVKERVQELRRNTVEI